MTEEKKDAPAPKGRSKLVVILLAVNGLVLAGAAGAVHFVMTHPSGSAHAQPETEEAAPASVGPLLAIEPMVVNLDEAETPRFARLALQLELADEEAVERVTARAVPIRSAIILYVSGLHADDLRGRERREQLLEQIRTSANQTLGGPVVRRVYLADLVVQ